MMEFLTQGGIKTLQQANEYPLLTKYYDAMVGCFIFSEKKYNENQALRKEVVLFLKHAKAYTSSGGIDFDKTWVLELIQGYDDDQPELGNDAWMYSLRAVDIWS